MPEVHSNDSVNQAKAGRKRSRGVTGRQMKAETVKKEDWANKKKKEKKDWFA